MLNSSDCDLVKTVVIYFSFLLLQKKIQQTATQQLKRFFVIYKYQSWEPSLFREHHRLSTFWRGWRPNLDHYMAIYGDKILVYICDSELRVQFFEDKFFFSKHSLPLRWRNGSPRNFCLTRETTRVHRTPSRHRTYHFSN